MKFKEFLREVWADALIITLVVIAILIVAGLIKSETIRRTGLKCDSSSTTDTVYVVSNVSSVPFDAQTLWISLGPDASGTVTIRRSVHAPSSSQNFLTWQDPATTVVLHPGEAVSSSDGGFNAFLFVKTSGTDKLWYSASMGYATDEVIWNNSSDISVGDVTASIPAADSLETTANHTLARVKTMVVTGDTLNARVQRVWNKNEQLRASIDSLKIKTNGMLLREDSLKTRTRETATRVLSIRKAVDSLVTITASAVGPPFLKGTSHVSMAAGPITFNFLTENGVAGAWGYTYVSTSGHNTSNITVVYSLNSVTRRTIVLGPGGSIADYVACDNISITKPTAVDTVYYGGYYNR